MDIIYHSMPTTWKNKMIEQGFNYADSTIKETTQFFETRVKNLEPKEEKKKSFTVTKKSKERKSIKKRKQEDSNWSSEFNSVEYKAIKNICILHEKCSHLTDNWKDLLAMVNKHKQKKEEFQDLQKEQQWTQFTYQNNFKSL